MTSHRIASLLALPLLLCVTGARGAQLVTTLQDDSSLTVYRIDQPNVQQRQTAYPQVRFSPGDSVNVAAGGCVQTGGHGKTWKRYVDPSGDNSDHLYHGLIGIPGLTNGAVRLQQFGLGADHQLPDPLPRGVDAAAMVLSLGYEDDDFSDNGYYKHDDGTDGQCSDGKDAYVVIAVGHRGALAPDASKFVGIAAANYRCQAAWAFRNFGTSTLDWTTFTNAFDLGISDYLDPATYVTYLFGSKLAAGGNCEGMSLLSVVGEDQFQVGDMHESFWQNYKSQNQGTPDVQKAINTAHWQQLSTYFLRAWLGNYFDAPETAAAAAAADLGRADYNYGLLSIAHGLGGHVLVPLAVTRSGAQTLIDVYDPNRPCGGIPDTASYPKVVIEGGHWSYQMAGDDGMWSGTSGLVYIPYHGSNGWNELGTNGIGSLTVIFGEGAGIRQVTDGRNRRLFTAEGRSEVDESAGGLGRSLLRLPVYSAGAAQKRPRNGAARFTQDHAKPLTPAVQARLRELDAEYRPAYGRASAAMVAKDATLTDLTFLIAGGDAAHPVRTMIRQRDTFFEVQATGPHLLTIKAAGGLGAGGISLKSTASPIQAVITQGTGGIYETTAPLAVTAQETQAQIVGGAFDLLTRGTPTTLQVHRIVTQRDGSATKSDRSVTMKAMP